MFRKGLAVAVILLFIGVAFAPSINASKDPIPDLECDGYLGWYDVKLGSTIYNSFKVKNVGELGSELDWEIESYPDWGTWTFIPDSGEDLTPEDDPVTIEITVVVPDEQIEFTGIVRVVNSENPSDYCDLEVFLTSPPSASIIKPERAIYINNERIMWFFVPLIIGSGDLDIEVTTSSWIDWVEFYIDGELQHIDYTRPFSWTWDEPEPLRHEIRAKAHDLTKKYTTQTINVWRFF